jgi:hypothetical protein
MTHPIGEVPHAGLEPDLFERFHREMVDIKNNRKYTYTQRLYDKGYSKSEMQSKRTAINSKYNQKSLMTATTLRALEGLLSQDLFIAIAKDILKKERYTKKGYDDAKYILETLKQHDPHTKLSITKDPKGIEKLRNKKSHKLRHTPYAGLSKEAFETFKHHIQKTPRKDIRSILHQVENSTTAKNDMATINYICREERRMDIRIILRLEKLFPTNAFIQIAESAIINDCSTLHSDKYLEPLERLMDERDPSYKQRRRLRRQMARKNHLINSLHLVGLAEEDPEI